MSKKIVAIVGTYRRARIVDSAVDELLGAAKQCDCQTEKIYLLDKHIEFCTNCRSCTQRAGEVRGNCVIDDDMKQILDEIDSADAIVLASPVNFFNITAITKRFIERLVCYAYWPWNGKSWPKNRIKKLKKKAVLITASGCPEFPGRIFFRGAFSVMNAAANCLGAKVVKKIYIGGAAVSPNQPLPKKYRKQACAAGNVLGESK